MDVSCPQEAHDYSVKIVNPRRKSDFTVLKLKSQEKFFDVDDLKKQVAKECKGKVEEPIRQIGYIEPGHGLRGKLRWLSSNDDLCDMYELFRGKKELILWTYAPSESDQVTSKKITRPKNDDEATGKTTKPKSDDSSDDKAKKRPRYEGHVDKMAKVDESCNRCMKWSIQMSS